MHTTSSSIKNMSFADFLKAYRKARNLNQTQLAELIGVGQKQISKYETSKSIPPPERVIPISKALGVDPIEIVEAIYDLKVQKDHQLEEEHAMIPLYKIEVAAGLDGIANGDYPEKETDLPFKRHWLESKGYKGDRLKDLILMRAKGDSMEPTISSGEVLLVDIGEAMRTPESIEKGRVYVVRWGITKEDISVKRLFFDLPRKIAIAVSDNPLFKQVDVDLSEYERFQDFVLGRVVWVGKENI